jgi:hypothetical protein
MRPMWTNREQGARVSDLYGPHTPRESGSAGPWYVPRPTPRLLDKTGRPVPPTAGPFSSERQDLNSGAVGARKAVPRW